MGEAPDTRPVPARPHWPAWVTSRACLAQKARPLLAREQELQGRKKQQFLESHHQALLGRGWTFIKMPSSHHTNCRARNGPPRPLGPLTPSSGVPFTTPRLPRHQARGIRQRTSGLPLPGVTSPDQPGSKPLRPPVPTLQTPSGEPAPPLLFSAPSHLSLSHRPVPRGHLLHYLWEELSWWPGTWETAQQGGFSVRRPRADGLTGPSAWKAFALLWQSLTHKGSP